MSKTNILPLFMMLWLMLPSSRIMAQGGCSTTQFSIENYQNCCYRLHVDNSTECVAPQLRLLLDAGSFAGWGASTSTGWTGTLVSPTELILTHSGSFVPLGASTPVGFCIPIGVTANLTVLWDFACSPGEGCFANLPLTGCTDPMDASITGVKYRECGQLPYTNQPTLSGWTITLCDQAGNQVQQTQTAPDGSYSFFDLAAGTYTVKEQGQPGWTASFPASGQANVTVAASQHATQNFGNCQVCSCDAIYFAVTPKSSVPDTCCYNLNVQNTAGTCFNSILVELSGTAKFSSSAPLLAGWQAQLLNPQRILLFAPGPKIPTGNLIPLTFCVTGSAVQNIAVSTFWTSGANDVICSSNFSFNCPPAAENCCPAGFVQGPDQIINGNFENGPGFGTDYTLSATCNPGRYNVLAGPQLPGMCPEWGGVDHTFYNNTGKMLAADGSQTPGQAVWRQQLTITKDTKYAFCAYVNNLNRTDHNDADPIVEAWIVNGIYPNNGGGTKIATSNALPESPDNWVQISGLWTAPAVISQPYYLEIRTSGTSFSGNNFAVDDISFRSCSQPCKADFTVTAIDNCGAFQVTSTSTGALPITYQWCDGNSAPSYTAFLPPCNTYTVCVSITDANGCMSSATQTIMSIDSVPPVLSNCPPHRNVNVNPGQCYFSGPLQMPTVADDCDLAPTIYCSLLTAGSSILITPQTQFPKGQNEITCIAQDFCGNQSNTCTYTLNVKDNEPPKITCPLGMTVQGTINPQGLCKAVVNNLAPIATDNCPMLNVAYLIAPMGTTGANDVSGTNFMQGVNTVTYTATDMGGNTATCSFNISVKCDTMPPSKFKCGMAVTTYYSISNPLHKVLSVRDIRNCSPEPKVQNWLAPEIWDPSWTVNNLGEVFGIAIDKSDNIYVCATSIYSSGTLAYGPAGSGGIYKIDAGSCQPSTFVGTAPGNAPLTGVALIPNAGGAALGNICYDPNHSSANGQFFVTNLEDGRIYRINGASGQVLSTFDPFTADANTPGMACEPERIWGIAYHPSENRVYFARCRQNSVHSGSGPNQIWSVALNGAGNFSGAEVHEIDLPPLYGGRSNPISDIEFSSAGKMILAEHSESDNTGCARSIGAHNSRVLEYIGSNSLGWTPSPNNFYVGNYDSGNNAAGGVDYGYDCYNPAVTPIGKCDESVWASGDALIYPSVQFPPGPPYHFVYGIAGIPASGNSLPVGTNYTPLNAYYVDDDLDISNGDKTYIGDVDILHCGCPAQANLCDSINVTSMSFNGPQDTCCFKLTMHNQKPNFFTGVQVCAPSGVSISAITALSGWSIVGYTAQQVTMVPVGPFIGTAGAKDFLKFCLSNYQSVPTQQVIIKYFGPDFTEVCRDTLIYNCTQKPKCIKVTAEVKCEPNGPYKMTFCVMSDPLIGFNVNSIQLNPPPGVVFTPSSFNLSSPLAPGQMVCNLMTIISGAVVDGQTICFTVTAKSGAIGQNDTNCCTDTVMQACVILPDCVCKNVSASATSVNLPGNKCCWKINLTNNYSNTFFSGVTLDIITPGVVFGAINNTLGSGWSLSSTATHAQFNKIPPGGTTIGSTAMLPDICLNGVANLSQVPQVIVLSWLGLNGHVVCRDTLYFDCQPPPDDDCVTLLNPTVICDPASPGSYLLSFQVYNSSGFNANLISLNNITPGGSITPDPYLISSPGLVNLSTSGIYTVNILGVPAGGQVCFNVTLHNVTPNGIELNCCTSAKKYCFTMPECSDSCKCGPFEILYSVGHGPLLFKNCGDTLSVPPSPGLPIAFLTSFQCYGTDCPPATVDWVLTGPTGFVSQSANGLAATPGFVIPISSSTFTLPGLYQLTMTGHCGSHLCPCVIYFTAQESQCCKDSIAFFNLVNQGFTVTQNAGCSVTVCAPQFGDCHYLGMEPTFGDGTSVPTVTVPANGCWSHTYTQSGTYNVCATVYEDTCYRKQMCTLVTVVCDTICTCNPGAVLTLTKDSSEYPIGCAHGAFTPVIPCSPGPVFVNGNFGCTAPDGAPCESLVNWRLEHPAGTPVASGTASSSASWVFNYNAPGGYYLFLETVCPGSGDTCRCVGRWIQEGCDSCTCELFGKVKIFNKKTGFNQNLQCNNQPPLAITCPPPGKPYFITGQLICNPLSCTGSDIQWIIKKGSVTISSGAQPGPWFSIPLSTTTFSSGGGLYTVTLTGMCGGQTCTCSFNFEVSSCPPVGCQCDDEFKNDVYAGFNWSTIGITGCTAIFRPNKQTECDSVVWTITGPGVSQSGYTTFANPVFFFNIPSGANGSYTVTMHVFRRRADGTYCDHIFIKVIHLQCNVVTADCSDPLVGNGGFTQNAAPGVLGADGQSEGWTRRSGTPELVGDEGCVDPYYLRLAGKCHPVLVDIVDHKLTPGPKKGFKLSLCYNAVADGLQPGTELVARLSETPQSEAVCGGLCKEIARIRIDSSTCGMWNTVRSNFYLENATGLQYLTLHLENELAYDEPDANSAIFIDNICLEQDDSTYVTATHDAEIQASRMFVFPNPNAGTFTVEFPAPALPGYSLRIIDLTGRLVNTINVDTGTQRQGIDVGNMPGGLYFLQLCTEGKVAATVKFVKQ